MICFLTSRIDLPEEIKLDPSNRFTDELKRCFPANCRALFVCSNPDGHDKTDKYARVIKYLFEDAGFYFESFCTLDGRNENEAAKLVCGSDLIILSGGHVPTQNRFFQKIGLRKLMSGFDGIVIGISAGSMNSADAVYSQPEEEGEATDPYYNRYLTGLGLTKTMLLPHYQAVKDETLDGLHLFDDIARPDSIGKTFYAIPDGSYLFISSGREELRGEAYMIKDGSLTRISSVGDTLIL